MKKNIFFINFFFIVHPFIPCKTTFSFISFNVCLLTPFYPDSNLGYFSHCVNFMHSLSACCEASLHCELLKVSFKQFGQTHRLIKRTKKRVTFVNFCALRKIGKFGFWIKGTSNLCRFETKARRIKLKKSALFQSRFRGLNQRDTIFELAIQFFLSAQTKYAVFVGRSQTFIFRCETFDFSNISISCCTLLERSTRSPLGMHILSHW